MMALTIIDDVRSRVLQRLSQSRIKVVRDLGAKLQQRRGQIIINHRQEDNNIIIEAITTYPNDYIKSISYQVIRDDGSQSEEVVVNNPQQTNKFTITIPATALLSM